MVNKKRFIARIAVVSIFAVMSAGLAACSGGASGSGAGGRDLVIGMNSGLVAQFQRYAKEFETTHKGYKVTVKAVPDQQSDYIQQLTTEGLSKSLPDIVFNYDTLNQTLAAHHLLYDIKPWLDSGHDGLKGSGFESNFIGQYKVGNQITGIPVSADTGVVMINKALFQKYGVAMPTEGWTYEDMYSTAKEITQKSGGNVYGLRTPIGDGSALFTFYPVLKADGSNLYDAAKKKFVFANAGGVRAWTTLLQPYTEGFGSPFSVATKATNYLQSGQAAMTVDSTATVSNYRSTMKDDWDMIPMPSENGTQATGGGSYSLSITQNSDNKEGAYGFLAWFYSTNGGMKAATSDGVIPATAEGMSNGAWLHPSDPTPASFVKTVKASVPHAILPNPIPDAVQPKVVPALQQALQEVILKHVSVQQAYTEAQNQLNALLK